MENVEDDRDGSVGVRRYRREGFRKIWGVMTSDNGLRYQLLRYIDSHVDLK
jgi:hypothetical protein